MSRQPALRPLDEEREATVTLLTDAFTSDRLTTEQFEGRVERAYRAATKDELAELTADLAAPAPEQSSKAVVRSTIPARISSILSSVERGGALVVPATLEVRAVLGNVELDLRDAELVEGVTEIRVRAVLGNVEIIVPAGVEIECRGTALLGSFGGRARTPGLEAPAPRVVRVDGHALLGNVECTSAPDA